MHSRGSGQIWLLWWLTSKLLQCSVLRALSTWNSADIIYFILNFNRDQKTFMIFNQLRLELKTWTWVERLPFPEDIFFASWRFQPKISDFRKKYSLGQNLPTYNYANLIDFLAKIWYCETPVAEKIERSCSYTWITDFQILL